MNHSDINYNLPASMGRRVMLVFAVLGAVCALTLQSYISGMLNAISLERFLAMQFSWNVAMFDANLAALGPASQAYGAHLWYDLLYPVAYSTFLFCTLFLLMTPKPRGFNLLESYRRAWALDRFRKLRAARGLAAFPIVAGLADLVENGATIFLLGGEANRTDPLVFLAFCATLAKWAFIILSIGVGVYAMLVQWLAKHSRRA